MIRRSVFGKPASLLLCRKSNNFLKRDKCVSGSHFPFSTYSLPARFILLDVLCLWFIAETSLLLTGWLSVPLCPSSLFTHFFLLGPGHLQIPNVSKQPSPPAHRLT